VKAVDIPRPLWVRPKEACRLTGLGMTRVYELLNSGDLQSRKLGRARLVSVASIERLGDDQKPEAA
jgi:excisionase family DNA binding protein